MFLQMVISTIVLQVVTGGLLSVTRQLTVSTCIHTHRVLYLRIVIIVEEVLPFAVLYGRGEGWNIKDIFLEYDR